jgi:hypothetical protein
MKRYDSYISIRKDAPERYVSLLKEKYRDYFEIHRQWNQTYNRYDETLVLKNDAPIDDLIIAKFDNSNAGKKWNMMVSRYRDVIRVEKRKNKEKDNAK